MKAAGLLVVSTLLSVVICGSAMGQVSPDAAAAETDWRQNHSPRKALRRAAILPAGDSSTIDNMAKFRSYTS